MSTNSASWGVTRGILSDSWPPAIVWEQFAGQPPASPDTGGFFIDGNTANPRGAPMPPPYAAFGGLRGLGISRTTGPTGGYVSEMAVLDFNRLRLFSAVACSLPHLRHGQRGDDFDGAPRRGPRNIRTSAQYSIRRGQRNVIDPGYHA